MRTLLLAAAVSLLTLPVSAQTAFGLRAGLNAATVSDVDEEEIDGVEKQARLGLVAGVMADVPLTPQLSFHPELLYTQKGYEVSVDADDPALGSIDGSITLRLDYLEVPLLLRYAVPVGPNGLVVGVEAGPTLAYKLNVGASCSGVFDELDCDDGLDEDDQVRDFDLGVAGGLTVGAGPFGVGLRYTQGVTSINDPEGANADDFEPRNAVVSVTGHYLFGR